MNEQDYILFEDYLTKKLSNEKRKTFEDRLLTEVKFKKAFETYKDLSLFLEHQIGDEEKIKDFENNLKNISNNYFETKTTNKTIKFKPWKLVVAASIVLLIGTYTYNMMSTPSYDDFSNYETISLTVRGTQNELLNTAEKAFNTKDFTKATTYFEQLLKINPKNQELQLYKAISEIEINKYDDAEKLLLEISKGNSVYKNKALWLLALSKLKQKDYKSCAKILKTIPQDADEYQKAQKLLKKL